MVSYNGLPVFTPVPKTGTTHSIRNAFLITGDIQNARTQSTNKINKISYAFSVYQDNVTDRKTLLDFFKQQQGKYLPFWYIEPIEVNEVLRVEGTLTFYLKSVSLNYLESYKTTYMYIVGTDAAFEVDTIVVYYDAALGKLEKYTILYTGDDPTIVVGDKLKIMSLVRFDMDTLKFDADDMDTSSSSVKLKEVMI